MKERFRQELSQRSGTAEQITAEFGVPEAEFGEQLKSLKDKYGFTPEDVRAWVEARL